MRLNPSLVSLLVILGAATPASAADDAPATWLYVLTGEVQSAATTAITIGADPTVIAFSDRPERLIRTTSVETFVDRIWEAGKDSFASDPPNAALVADEGQVAIDALMSLERNGRTVSFRTSELDGGPPAVGSRVALVIDYGTAGAPASTAVTSDSP